MNKPWELVMLGIYVVSVFMYPCIIMAHLPTHSVIQALLVVGCVLGVFAANLWVIGQLTRL